MQVGNIVGTIRYAQWKVTITAMKNKVIKFNNNFASRCHSNEVLSREMSKIFLYKRSHILFNVSIQNKIGGAEGW